MRIQETSIVGQLLTLINPIGKEIPLRVGEIVQAQVVDLFPSGGLTLKVKDGFLPARTDLDFQINDTLSLKVLGRERGGEALKLQLISDTISPGAKQIRRPIPPGGEIRKVSDLLQQTSDQILKLIDLGSKEVPDPSLLPGSAVGTGKIRELLECIFKTLPSDIQSLPKELRLHLQQVLQRAISGSGQELQKKILHTISQLPEGINNPLGIRSLKNELLVFMEGLHSGQLQKALENSGVVLEGRIATLVKGFLVKMPEVLQRDLKGSVRELQQNVIQTFARLPEGINDPLAIQRLRNELLVSLEEFFPGQLQKALENSGVAMTDKLTALVKGFLTKVPEELQGALKGSVQELQQKIIQAFARLPEGINDPPAIQRLRNELLVSLGAPQTGPLLKGLEDLGAVWETKVKSMMDKTQVKVPEELLGGLKGSGRELEQKIVQAFSQLPEGISDSPAIQRLRNEILVSIEGLQSGQLKKALENSGVVLEAKLKALVGSTLVTLPGELQEALKGSGRELQQKVVQAFSQLPEGVNGSQAIERLKNEILVSMEGLQSGQLKKALENSGVVLEAKLKALVEGTSLEVPIPFQNNEKIHKDLKTLLLQFKEILDQKIDQNSPPGFIERLLEGGKQIREDDFGPYQKEMRGVESLLKDVETFQLLSKITDSFYTFLPVQWMELKRGELVFKRRRSTSGEASYSCGIHLNLERLGPVSVFIYMQQKDFYVTFKVDHPVLDSLIKSHQGELQEKFRDLGLNLKNIHSLHEMDGLPAPLERIGSEDTIVSIRI